MTTNTSTPVPTTDAPALWLDDEPQFVFLSAAEDDGQADPTIWDWYLGLDPAEFYGDRF